MHSLSTSIFAPSPDFRPAFTFNLLENVQPVHLSNSFSYDQYQPQVSPAFTDCSSLLSKRTNPYTFEDTLTKKPKGDNGSLIQQGPQTNSFNYQTVFIQADPLYNDLTTNIYSAIPQISAPQFQVIGLPIIVGSTAVSDQTSPIAFLQGYPMYAPVSTGLGTDYQMTPFQDSSIYTEVMFQNFQLATAQVPVTTLQQSVPMNLGYQVPSTDHSPPGSISSSQERIQNLSKKKESVKGEPKLSVKNSKKIEKAMSQPKVKDTKQVFTVAEDQVKMLEKKASIITERAEIANIEGLLIPPPKSPEIQKVERNSPQKDEDNSNENDSFVIRIKAHKVKVHKQENIFYSQEPVKRRKNQWQMKQEEPLPLQNIIQKKESVEENEPVKQLYEPVSMKYAAAGQAEIPSFDLEEERSSRKAPKLKWNPEAIPNENLLKLVEDLEQALKIPINQEKLIRLLGENENCCERVMKLVREDSRKYAKFFALIRKSCRFGL